MNDWMAHLKAQGGHLSDDHNWQFPEDDRRRPDADDCLIPLMHHKVLECEGPDAARFLQGQTSASVDHANGDFAPLTAFCTPKGRMLANAELLRVAPERFWLLLDVSLTEPLAQQLGKYAPFYKMTLRRRDDLVLFGVIGAPATLDRSGLPDAPWHMAQHETAVVVRHPGERPRWLFAMDESHAIAEWNHISAGARLAGNRLWRRADIDAGLAWLTAEHSDSFLPQMINWEALGGISFRKGCYTGQEVVARAHFRGQVKRRLQIATLEGVKAPAIGNEIRNAEGKRVGEVFLAIADEREQRCRVLAIVNTGLKDNTGLENGATLTIDDRVLTPEPLPYPLERLDPESIVTGSDSA